MKLLLPVLTSHLFLSFCPAAPPAFQVPSVPDGWTIVRGEADAGAVRSAKPAPPLELRTAAPMSLPLEATFRFRAAQGDVATFKLSEGSPDSKGAAALLSATFRPTAPAEASIQVLASGKGMAAAPVTSKAYNLGKKHTGQASYSWRFPKVKNLWNENDRKEIGAAYNKLVPFEEKTFVLRFTVTPTSRQVWVDDRLIAEAPMSSPREVFASMEVSKGAQILSAEFSKPASDGRFLPLSLAHWSHAKQAQVAQSNAALTTLQKVPVLVPATSKSELHLGESLYRYRMTHGTGPDTGYVNAKPAWPSPLEVDPAALTFRVPYRAYKNVWLLAWVDAEAPHAVPTGAFRFFRTDAGYPATTSFEITDSAIAAGKVTQVPEKAANGRPLYLIRVPVDTDGFYGFRDMADQFLDFELTKPLALGRSYPDPIYYGFHPAGLPSSIHVVGITLEEGAFSYEVKPKQVGYVFEQPDRPACAVAVSNASGQPLQAKVTLQSKSYDGTEQKSVSANVMVGIAETKEADLRFDLQKLGWHELKITVEAGGEVRQNTLSMVLLPPNTRTYGEAPNEVRFGTWNLLGHYTPLSGDFEKNDQLLGMFRKLGLRRITGHSGFVTPEMLKKNGFLPNGPHTISGNRWSPADPAAEKKGVEREVAAIQKASEISDNLSYFYGGEWHMGRMAQYAPWPFYTGDGDRDLDDEERGSTMKHLPLWTAIGRGIREKFPKTKLILQWGAPLGTSAYMRAGFPKDLVDGYGMDAPMFELLPEASNATGSINMLWMLRREAERLGWPNLPIHWCEGPFFPTNPGALTEDEQANNQVRYLLLGLGYGVEDFQAGIVPHDAGNYYGAEHYGAGLFHRRPLENPKPAVAAVATMTSMLCGADTKGGVDTGSLTTYCMGFERTKDMAKIFALWRVTGTSVAHVKVLGAQPTLTDSMGNATKLPVKNGAVQIPISATPVWLTGVEAIEGFVLEPARYDSAPAKVTRPLADMAADKWAYDGSEDKAYAYNHFSVRRIPDPLLTAEFGQGEDGYADAVAVTLPVEPGDRPLATRYGALVAKKPLVIPGKASALGIYLKGNSSWGRVIYRLRDAKGELWTSSGTKDDWNCDDTHGWSFVNFDGWRYVRFPLPGNQPYDNARDLESTWWGSQGGDGIVDLPLSVDRIIVEARNEVPVLGQMKLVPERSYKLSHLICEYEAEGDAATFSTAARYRARMATPVWAGPTENVLAKLTAEGSSAPELRDFAEPPHFNDGRRMIVNFDEAPGVTYNLYLSLFPDGRGADLLKPKVKAGSIVTGLKPETPLYFFLTSIGADKKESKPSKAVKLITHDKFLEK